MTLILGMYYNNEKGALIAADSRALSKLEIMPLTKKICGIKNVIFSLSGITYLTDQLLEDLEEKLKVKINSQEIRDITEQSFVSLRENILLENLLESQQRNLMFRIIWILF